MDALPTIDLPQWLNDVAVPLAEKALDGTGENSWIHASAKCKTTPYTMNVVVYSEAERRSWDLENTPCSGHEKLALLTMKHDFVVGWNALVTALCTRYDIIGAGMNLDFKFGVPHADIYTTVPGIGAHKAKIQVLGNGHVTLSVEALLEAFCQLDLLNPARSVPPCQPKM